MWSRISFGLTCLWSGSVVAKAPAVPSTVLPNNSTQWLGWAGLGALVVVAMGVGFWRTRRRQQQTHREQQGQADTIERLKKKLRIKTKKAKQLKTERSALIDLIGRDLNAPLMRSETLLDLLREAGHLNEAQQQYLELIRATNAQGTRLIGHITTIRQLESYAEDFPLGPANLSGLLRQVVDELDAEAEAAGLQLNLNAPDELEWTTHPEAFRELVRHLLRMCIYSSPARSRVAIALLPNGQKCRLRVKSEGPPLTEEELEQMLHPFYQLGGTQPANEQLSGIEIGVVKAYAKKLHALVDAESEAGKGTEFLVDFPR